MGSINFNVGFRGEKRDTLGYKVKDIAIPIEINQNNYDIKANFDLNAIKESLHNIFQWFKGERILNPEFGNPLIEYIYEPINNKTAQQISVALKNSITTWDGRIVIKQLSVEADPDSNQYNIILYYDVPILDLYNLDYKKLVTIEE